MTKPSFDQRRKTIASLWANGTQDAKLFGVTIFAYDYIKKLKMGNLWTNFMLFSILAVIFKDTGLTFVRV